MVTKLESEVTHFQTCVSLFQALHQFVKVPPTSRKSSSLIWGLGFLDLGLSLGVKRSLGNSYSMEDSQRKVYSIGEYA